MKDRHELNLTTGDCTCGEQVRVDEITLMIREWSNHITILDLLERAREHALQERISRRIYEKAILHLIELGLSSHQISKEIGHDDDGNLMVSSTLVLRLGRAEHKQKPRRRRRS